MYHGCAPVAFDDYVQSVMAQLMDVVTPDPERLRQALSHLTMTDQFRRRIGQAVTGGRSLYLYGEPGNGKTSIAQRLTDAYGGYVWIPRTITCEGEIIRIFDSIVHTPVTVDTAVTGDYDERWILIERPTIVVGGELMLEHLEFTPVPRVGICEAPVHMKSNCGTLIVDDFGRQRIPISELLNRWIVPLEK